MIGKLPKELAVCGKNLPINTDFRQILALFPMFADPKLTDTEKAFVCCRRIYRCKIDASAFADATIQAYRFIDGGEIPKSEPEKAKIIDWEKDEKIIIPAISKTLGVIDVRELPYLHWWTFLGAFGEIGEGILATVLNLRRKRAAGEKLDKWEEKYVRRNRDLIIIESREDEEALAETEAFIKELFHE